MSLFRRRLKLNLVVSLVVRCLFTARRYASVVYVVLL